MLDFSPHRARLQIWLASPSLGWCCAALALVLSLPAIGSHRVFDDFVLALGARASQDTALATRRFGILDLFTFTTGAPAENHRLADLGSMLPWWSDPELEVAFFRPLSALTHVLDEVLYPNWVWLHYVHSLVWLGVLVLVVARLYRAMGGPPAVAGLAALLYAIDDAHGPAVGWLSNRNGIIAAVFGVVALIAHDLWRQTRRSRWAAVAACSLMAGLLAGESALATCAYLVAYAAVFELGPPKRRAVSLWPYAGVVATWAITYKMAGYAAKHSGIYVDPLADAGRFAAQLPSRALALLGAAFGPIPADCVLFEQGAEHRGLLVAAITLFGTACLLVPTLRSDRQARFWALGIVLAAVPFSACYPTDRLLVLVGIGAMALVARIVAGLLGVDGRASSPAGFSGARRYVALAMSFVHLALAPVLLPLRASQMRLVAAAIAPASEALDQISDLSRRTVVIINPPIDPFVSYLQAERALRNLPRPQHLYWLANALTPIRIRREGPRTLILAREGGLIAAPIERLYRSPSDLPGAGWVTSLSQMSAEIVSTTADGRPLEVRFEFDDTLEAHQYVFLVWDEGRLLPFDMPSENEMTLLPRQDIGHIVLSALRGKHHELGSATTTTILSSHAGPHR
jgi:hypothetical protein